MSKLWFFAAKPQRLNKASPSACHATPQQVLRHSYLEKQFPAVVFFRQACARGVGLVESSVKLNQVTAPIAKQMCRAEPAKIHAELHCQGDSSCDGLANQ
jgi:hypothetical protein